MAHTFKQLKRKANLERKNQHLMSVKVVQKCTEGNEEEYNRFCAEIINLYNKYLEYLGKWMIILEEFQIDNLE